MQQVSDIARAIVAREGGFVNDPDDPGGATKHGLSLRALKGLGKDLNGDERIDVQDIHAVTPELAQRIFIETYFRRPRICDLPQILQPTVFDMYVNAGANAVKILQRLLMQIGQNVVVDGVIGPKTIAAAEAATALAPDHIVDAYGIARRNYYLRIADRRPASRKYVCRRDGGKGGWIIRAEEFIAPRYHLTHQEFRERVSAWG